MRRAPHWMVIGFALCLTLASPAAFALRPESDLTGLEERLHHGAIDGLPSYLHVHTTASYEGVPGVASPAHVIQAAHEANQTAILIVEHESLDSIDEAQQAAARINIQRAAQGLAPLQVAFGVEFAAPVDPEGPLAQIPRTAGRPDYLWVIGYGVPLHDAGKMAQLRQLVTQFQAAKRRRAERQVELLNRALQITLQVPEGNITERRLVFLAAQAELGPTASLRTLGQRADEIRQAVLGSGGPADVPYSTELGFMPFEELVPFLRDLRMIPTFPMQVAVDTLKGDGFLPMLAQHGIEAIDVAGIKPDESAEVEKMQWLIGDLWQLSRREIPWVIGGSDYRGEGTGWRDHAPWMDHQAVRESFAEILRRSNGGLEEAADLSNTLFLVFDPAAGKALLDALRVPVLIVAPSPEAARIRERAGVPLARLVGIVGNGYERDDYGAFHGLRLIRVDPSDSRSWKEQVRAAIEGRLDFIDQKAVVVIDSKTDLRDALKDFKVSTEAIDAVLAVYARAEEVLATSQ